MPIDGSFGLQACEANQLLTAVWYNYLVISFLLLMVFINIIIQANTGKE